MGAVASFLKKDGERLPSESRMFEQVYMLRVLLSKSADFRRHLRFPYSPIRTTYLPGLQRRSHLFVLS